MKLQILAEIDDGDVFKGSDHEADSQDVKYWLQSLIREHGCERVGAGRQGAGDQQAADETERPRRVVVPSVRGLVLDQGHRKAELAHCGQRSRQRGGHGDQAEVRRNEQAGEHDRADQADCSKSTAAEEPSRPRLWPFGGPDLQLRVGLVDSSEPGKSFKSRSPATGRQSGLRAALATARCGLG